MNGSTILRTRSFRLAGAAAAHPTGADATAFRPLAARLFPVVSLTDRHSGRDALPQACATQSACPDLAAAALGAWRPARSTTGALRGMELADVADADLVAAAIRRRNSKSCATAGSASYGAAGPAGEFLPRNFPLAVRQIPDGGVVQSLIAAHALARGVLPVRSR